MNKRCKLCGGLLIKLSGDYPRDENGKKIKTERFKTPNYKCVNCGQLYEDKLKMVDSRIA